VWTTPIAAPLREEEEESGLGLGVGDQS
jgi:hypothetical protein